MHFGLVLLLIGVVFVTFLIGQGNNTIAALATPVFFVGAGVLYFAPTIQARMSEHPRFVPILIINLFLGWTLLGWVGALAWAYSTPQKA